MQVDSDRCTVCGACVQVCKGAPLFLDAGRVRIDQSRLFGCIGCGHCVAVCPEEAITVSGRDLTPEDVISFASVGEQADYSRLYATMLARRSVRDFEDRPVEQELIDRILAAATTAPMGLPPSEVGVLVVSGRQKVRELKDDLLGAMRSVRWLLAAPALAVLRPFIGQDNYEAFRSFVAPALDTPRP